MPSLEKTSSSKEFLAAWKVTMAFDRSGNLPNKNNASRVDASSWKEYVVACFDEITQLVQLRRHWYVSSVIVEAINDKFSLPSLVHQEIAVFKLATSTLKQK